MAASNPILARMSFLATPATGSDRATAEQVDRDGLLAAISRLQPAEVFARLASNPEGLPATEADARLKRIGPNLVARERKATIVEELWGRARNPLNALLLTLAGTSYFLGDVRAAVVIAAMVVLAITTAFIQEHRSNEAAAQLRAMVHTTASVRRTPAETEEAFSEIPMERLVPGDVVRLSAGDMIPADLRLLDAKDLFVNQSALTGESMPTEKHGRACDGESEDAFGLENLCFMGANVVSGYGTGVIVQTEHYSMGSLHAGAINSLRNTLLANWTSGTVEFSVATGLRGGIAAVAVRFNDSGAFETVAPQTVTGWVN